MQKSDFALRQIIINILNFSRLIRTRLVVELFHELRKVFFCNYVRTREHNGMLRHSLATLEGGQDFIFFTEPSYPKNAPLSLYL